jgi:hypothetical protein
LEGDIEMERFFVEIPHEKETVACARAVRALLDSGSHFLTRADWGCKDGDHRAWMFLDMESKEDVRQIIPPAYRADAKVVKLNKFSLEEIDELLRYHGG